MFSEPWHERPNISMFVRVTQICVYPLGIAACAGLAMGASAVLQSGG